MLAEIEKKLRALMHGKHSSMDISFNDFASNYTTAKDETEAPHGAVSDVADWVSEEERAKAIEANSVWRIQWYPSTPIGSYTVMASSLEALLNHVFSKEWP